MANILHIATMTTIPSQHYADYLSPEFLIDPDLSAVEGVPTKYWKVVDGTVVSMSNEEILVIDTAETKNNKFSEIEGWYNNCLNTGYDTGNGYNLAATFTDQTRFTQDAVLQTQKVSLSLANLNDNIGFLDSNGVPRILTINDYLILLANYGTWCREKLIQKAVLLNQLAAALTLEEINNIIPN